MLTSFERVRAIVELADFGFKVDEVKMKKINCLWLFSLIITLPVIAQEACPANVIRAFARAGSACTDVERNQACLGNGNVQATFDSAFDASFTLVGERADTGLVQQLILNSEDEYPVASMQLQMNLLNTQPGRNMMLLAFGDVSLTNQVPVRPTVPIESTGVLNVRALPDIESDILAQYPLRTTITANGIIAEGNWLRVEIPDTSEIAWVARDLIITTGDLSTLNIVDIDTPFLRPFQVFTLITGQDDALCEGTTKSAILLQSPNLIEAIDMTINGVNILLTGTIVIQAVPDGEMTISQIEGTAFIRANNKTRWLVPASKVSIPLDSTLNIAGDISMTNPSLGYIGLPINNLNYRVRLPEEITQENIDIQIAELEAEPLMFTENSVMDSQRCRRIAQRRVVLYAGPAIFYEVIREVGRGSRLYPVLRLSDSEGVTWWQLSNGHWMLANRAESSDNCGEIPVTEIVQAPHYNVLTLETCDSSNGPIRDGQWVWIEFVVGSWETLEEALQAPRIDPGRITINERWHYVRAQEPRLVAEDRYYRTFWGTWYAEVGTYRIVGNRLSYTVVCDVTVPLG